MKREVFKSDRSEHGSLGATVGGASDSAVPAQELPNAVHVSPAFGNVPDPARFPNENPYPVLRVSANGRLLYANRASEPLLITWRVADDACLPMLWRERIASVLAAGERRKWDEECAGRVFELACVPFADAGYANVYGVDVTERVMLENQLRQSEAKAQELVRHAPSGIYEIDFLTGRFQTVNDAMCEILGYPRDELLAMSAVELLDEEGQALFAERTRRVLAGEDPGPAPEYRVKRLDGSLINVVLNSRITYHDGQPDAALVIAHDVTERRRAADETARQREQLRDANSQLQTLATELAEQQRFLATILETIPVQIAYLDQDLVYRLCNQAAAAEMGHPVEAVLGRRLTELHPDNPQVWEAVERVLRTGEPFRSEELPVTWPDRPDQGTQHYTVAYLPDKDATGHVRGVFAEGQRVTALVQARQQLERASDELEQRVAERTAELEAILASLPDALYIGNENGIYRCNKAALDYLGCDTIDELSEKIPALAAKVQTRYADTGQRLPPEDEPFVRALQGEPATAELLLRNLRTGKDIVVRSACAPIKFGGTVIGAVAVNTDITAQRRAQEKMAYQAMLLENVNDAIFAYDADLRITAWNRRAEEQYGWKAEEVIGANAPDVLGSRMTEEQRVSVLEALAATGRWQGEVVHSRRDGTPMVIEATAMRLSDKAGRTSGFVSVNRDITERKRAEDELRASREQLRTLSRRLVTMQEAERSYVADQLYNQAAQVLAVLQMQLSRAGRIDGRESPGDLLPTMQATVNEAMRELHELAVQLRPVGLDRSTLAGVLQSLVAEFGRAHGLAVRFQPGDTEALRLPADIATAVYRAVQEGLTNIARHAEASEVVLSLSRSGSRLAVTLADNGVGFEPANGSLTSGLGLASIRERLETVAGGLTVESGKAGTTMHMHVPLSHEEK